MRTRFNLSKAEQQSYHANGQRLKATGVVIEVDYRPSSKAPMLKVEQVGGVSDSVLYLPHIGVCVIAVWMRIVAQKSGVAICDCEIMPHGWDDPDMLLMHVADRAPYYRTFGGLEYPRADVLNHRISSGRPLGFGDKLEGVVIAQGPASVPALYKVPVRVDLCLFDQFDNPYELSAELAVMRQEKPVEPAKRRRGLFDFRETRESNPLPNRPEPDKSDPVRESEVSGASND